MVIVCPVCKSEVELDEGSEEAVCPSCGTTLSPSATTVDWRPAEFLQKIARFELLARIGARGFGTVYKARDTQLDRIVAVKVPRAGSLSTREDCDRFLREARNAAQLRHRSLGRQLLVGGGKANPPAGEARV